MEFRQQSCYSDASAADDAAWSVRLALEVMAKMRSGGIDHGPQLRGCDTEAVAFGGTTECRSWPPAR